MKDIFGDFSCNEKGSSSSLPSWYYLWAMPSSWWYLKPTKVILMWWLQDLLQKVHVFASMRMCGYSYCAWLYTLWTRLMLQWRLFDSWGLCTFRSCTNHTLRIHHIQSEPLDHMYALPYLFWVNQMPQQWHHCTMVISDQSQNRVAALVLSDMPTLTSIVFSIVFFNYLKTGFFRS